MNGKAIAVAQVTEAALEYIQKLTGVGGDKAAAALQVIGKVISTLREAHDGKVSPQAALGEIESLHNALLANEAEALAELHARFPT